MKSQSKFLIAGASFSLSFSTLVSAVDLSEVPLISAQAVDPNIMILVDTSGSMDAIVPDNPYDASIDYSNGQCTNDYDLPTNWDYYVEVESDGDVFIRRDQSGPDSTWEWGTEGTSPGNDDDFACFDSDAEYDDVQLVDGSGGERPYIGNYLNWYFSNYSEIAANQDYDADGNLDLSNDTPATGPANFGVGATRKPGTITRNETAITALKTLVGPIPSDPPDPNVNSLTNARIGLAGYNASSDTAQIISKLVDVDTDANRTTLLNNIDNLDASGSTPVTSALASLGSYFIGDNGASGFSAETLTREVTRTGDDPDTPAVEDSDHEYIETLTWDADDLFDHLPDYSSNSIAVPASPEEVIQFHCQRSVIISVTDGLPNGDDDYDSDIAEWEDGNECGDDDCRGDEADYDDISAAFYELDLRPSWTESHNNITTYHIGFGLQLDMLDRAARYGVGESVTNTSINAFNANSLDDLTTQLGGIVNQVQEEESTVSAVAFNTSRLATDSALYQARFTTANYSGQLLRFNLNADNGALRGLDGGVERDLLDTESIFDIDPIWEAGNKLDNDWTDAQLTDNTDGSYNPRNVYTFKNDSAAASRDGVTFTWANLSDSQKEDLSFGVTPVSATTGQAVIDYLLGKRSSEVQNGGIYRNRSSRLGDIVNSSPVFVGAPQLNWPDYDSSVPTAARRFGAAGNNYSTWREATAQTSRAPVVYVGANDGMLHGFNADTGAEIFAYIPGAVYSSTDDEGLHHLTETDYVHEFYVDLTPTVSDVYLTDNEINGGTDSWRTVLIGGLRSGGRGLFALDVTDPSKYEYTDPTDTTAVANADSIVMWEFHGTTTAGQGDPEMGYTYAQPTIVKMENGKWAAVVGNGYDSDSELAYLFIIFLEGGLDGEWTEGTDYIKIQAGSDTSNGLSTPRVIDTDGDFMADRAYAGDLNGNMWAFDLSHESDTTAWVVDYAGDPLFKATAPNNSDAKQPITTAPVATFHTPTEDDGYDPNLLILFGTGQYINQSDVLDPDFADDDINNGSDDWDVQTYYGVLDTGSHSDIDRNSLQSRSLITEIPSGFTNILRRIEFDDTDPTEEINYPTELGWHLDLVDTMASPNIQGERVVAESSIRGNVLFFNTLIPNNSECEGGGDGWLMSVDYLTGLGPQRPAFDANDDGFINSGDIDDESGLGYVGEEFLEGIPSESGFLNDQYTAGTTGEVEKRDVDYGIDKTGRLSWEELFRQ